MMQFSAQESKVLGCVRGMRTGKKISFLEIGYGESQVQVVVETSKLPVVTLGSFVSVTGTKTALPEGKYSTVPFEITDAEVTVLSLAASDLPAKCPTGAGLETKLAQRVFYFRDPEFIRILRLSDALTQSMRHHFADTKCVEITPPSFTGCECEGGATLFKLDHPGKHMGQPISAYLTQSSQFALEMCLPGLGDCFCIAPSFRAEHSIGRRHLTEFTHVEAEWGGILKFEEHLAKLKDLLLGTISHFLKLGETDLQALGLYERVIKLREQCEDIVTLTHREAIQKCRDLGIQKEPGVEFDDRDDIPEMHERKLIDTMDKIVFLVKFPKEFKSFYMALDPEDPSYVLGCDVEVPGVGEIIGSGVRETDYDRLLARLHECQLDPKDYEAYLDLRRYGFCMTSGMGLGLGRMLSWLLDKPSIREVVAFPRFPGYLAP